MSRRVSFRASPEEKPLAQTPTLAEHPTLARTPSTSSKASAMKSSPPALSDRVPSHMYTHSDPILRRLRLTSQGKDVDLESEFRDTEVVAYLFGSEWARGASGGNLGAYYENIVKMCRKQPHRFKVVFVSIDTDEAAFERSLAGRPWLAMEWNDGSNLPHSSHEEATTPTALARDEHYLLAEETDLEAHQTGYTRPYSRVFLASRWDIWAVPTMVVYQLPRPGKEAKVLNWKVRPEMLEGETKREKTWKAWEKGESADLSVKDVLYQMRWTFVVTLAVFLYFLFLQLNGADFAWLEKLVSNPLNKEGAPAFGEQEHLRVGDL